MYNQPFSQPPGMFGAQSAMAQMQSAPSLPAGNPGAREYFNYSMETLSNAAMPQAMMPQGIGSLVPQYQFGGGVSLADAISMASNAPDIESVQAAFDAAGISVPDFNAPSGPDASAQAEAEAQAAADSLNGASRGAATQGGPPDVDFTNLALETLQGGPPDVDFTNLALESLQDQQQAYQDYYDSRAAALTDPEYAESRQDLYNFLVNNYKGNVATGGGTFYESGIVDGKDETAKAEDLNKGLVNSLIATFTPFQKGPVYNPATGSMTGGTYVDRGGLVGGGLGALVGGPFGALVGGSLGSGRGGYVPVNSIMSGSDGFDNPDMDMISIPSQSEIDDIIARMTPPDTGDDIDPDLGDPQQAAAAVAPAYVPPVYQTYAGLGLPSVSPIPPLRRVTVPISSFVV